MTDEEVRMRCLEFAMEIYRRDNVPHMAVENVAATLYRFLKEGTGTVSGGASGAGRPDRFAYCGSGKMILTWPA